MSYVTAWGVTPHQPPPLTLVCHVFVSCPQARASAKKFRKVTLTVSPKGIVLTDTETSELIEDVSIYRWGVSAALPLTSEVGFHWLWVFTLLTEVNYSWAGYSTRGSSILYNFFKVKELKKSLKYN